MAAPSPELPPLTRNALSLICMPSPRGLSHPLFIISPTRTPNPILRGKDFPPNDNNELPHDVAGCAPGACETAVRFGVQALACSDSVQPEG